MPEQTPPSDNDFLNLTIHAAAELSHTRSILLRATMVDGHKAYISSDVRTDRLNVAIDKGLIVAVGERG